MLRSLALPVDAMEVLAVDGLPRSVTPLFWCDLTELASTDVGPDFLRIGSDGETAMCVEQTSGVVWSIDAQGRFPTRFVNQDLRRFRECILVTQVALPMLSGLGEEEFEEARTRLENQLRRIDGSDAPPRPVPGLRPHSTSGRHTPAA